MHKDFYHQPKPKLKVDLTLPKFLVIVITVMAFFVIPVQLISLSQSKDSSISAGSKISYQTPPATNTDSEPRVAGESTTNTNGSTASATGTSSSSTGLDFSDKSTQYAVLGIFFMSISFISLLYLFVTERQNKEFDIL